MREYTLGELAKLTDSALIGNPDFLISGVENLDAASSKEAAFLENPRYTKQLESSKAGVIFVQPIVQSASIFTDGKNFLINKNPSLAFQKVIELFIKSPEPGFTGIHPTAVIHESAIIGEEVSIGPNAVIDRNVTVGKGCIIGPCVCIGPQVTLGSNCLIYSNVSIREGCEIGNRVIIQPGAVIGSCGFGYYSDNFGKHHPLKQLGKVILEDDVEIGANTTIDRARFKSTCIKRGTKIDNLVQIGHQVEIGEDNLIVSQVGIAGSTKTGRNVVMGGQVGVAGHITITDGVMLAARAAVSKSLTEPGPYSGIPAAPLKEFNLHLVQLRSMGKFIDRIKALETRVKSLEE